MTSSAMPSCNPAISIKNLSKCYQLGTIGRHTLVDEVEYWWHKIRGRDPRAHLGVLGHTATETRKVKAEREGNEEFWALKDVSFDVQPGEVVGIIGRNGAGKSTLLKLLTRITEPTSGEIVIRGRVASLLEVGTGFHPELTGRENVYMNGTILGMKKREIAAKFDEIVAFAEIEKFIDTPVKRYSSGMYVRLAFAVAAHLEPEILLVDEVLAVGDAAFQKKCLGKMGDVAKQGRTVLFVSHNMNAVQSLCPRTTWLHEGRLLAQGDSAEIVPRYLREAVSTQAEQQWDDPQTAPGNDEVRLHSLRLVKDEGALNNFVTLENDFQLEIQFWNQKENAPLHLTLGLFNQEDVNVFWTTTMDEPRWHGKGFPRGLFRSRCRIPAHLLNAGLYRIHLMVVKNVSVPVARFDNVMAFEVQDDLAHRKDWYGRWPGVVRPQLEWTTEKIDWP